MIDNYFTLKEALLGSDGYTHRTDLDDKADTFMQSVTATLNRTLRAREMESEVIITSLNENFSLPSDLIELRAIYIGDRELVSYLTPNQSYDCNFSHEPYYTIIGDTLKLNPIPTQSTSLKIIYYAKLPTFVTPFSTNNILINYPMVYLYGMMAEFSLYAQDDERITLWDGKFNNEINSINTQAKEARYSGSPISIRGF